MQNTFKGEGTESEKVHEINTAFDLDTPEEKIREEVKKAGELFEEEQKNKEKQKEQDEKYKKAEDVINNLNQRHEKTK